MSESLKEHLQPARLRRLENDDPVVRTQWRFPYRCATFDPERVERELDGDVLVPRRLQFRRQRSTQAYHIFVVLGTSPRLQADFL